MASVIAEFFNLTGVNALPPVTMAELIPYLVNIFIGVVLVSGVFRVIGKIAESVMDFLRR